MLQLSNAHYPHKRGQRTGEKHFYYYLFI
jgi:hypothetical protein